MTRLPENVERLVRAVAAGSSARSEPSLRQAVIARAAALTCQREDAAAVPAALEPYVRTVVLHAYKVVDREVDALRTAGYSVDELFEVTVAAAVGAGLSRLEIALRAIDGARFPEEGQGHDR